MPRLLSFFYLSPGGPKRPTHREWLEKEIEQLRSQIPKEKLPVGVEFESITTMEEVVAGLRHWVSMGVRVEVNQRGWRAHVWKTLDVGNIVTMLKGMQANPLKYEGWRFRVINPDPEKIP